MSSYQPNFLPPGYSLRLADKRDVTDIIYFEYIDDGRCVEGLLFVTFVSIISTLLAVIFFPIIPGTAVLSGFSLGFVLFFLIQFLTTSKELSNNIEKEVLCIWLIEFKNKVRGYLLSRESGEYIFINRLLIGSSHQRIGLGSHLISRCVNGIVKPVYLICHSDLKPFYYRRSFVDADYSDIPPELLIWCNRKNHNLMVLRQSSSTGSN